jgi:hypothetical protein
LFAISDFDSLIAVMLGGEARLRSVDIWLVAHAGADLQNDLIGRRHVSYDKTHRKNSPSGAPVLFLRNS